MFSQNTKRRIQKKTKRIATKANEVKKPKEAIEIYQRISKVFR
ncbi:hypothetical protein LEP1GSC103_1302 [Leptospira borgpetersenii serovar Javanica str. UI 09931]|uniref:Uncharacterized protein n=5 Tax=Leptospira borgpetersenii TaxID=174 RepID=M3GDR1_LEPBO|nr:hypothetical protein LBBP_02867 [Leptospira borgpetersenii serovar Ballum]EKP15088.1 hypothetical protein LEP1GSC128_2396 [Leptospira borgpetersenii str. 200801926]EKQ90213.1 hypothetical protein LEP1GSC101_2191 [Leptospira borgpetersenii str. UI 09149]EKQ99218.1 hypothetical protein LEP1GSC121_2561 [Leptospira borgpetersenii serovar Castellonis str. 200801910]EMF99076.1 hypothetical protein LEP1GSC123_0161 [Leptospira borgpetersenii str. 200701203]EMK12109.1 hypothetical protein LEP1GSC066